MNERIAELAKKAGFCGTGFHNTLFGTTQEDALENFAELIVKECGVALNPPVQNRNVISRGQAYELIKQHFGVEE